jgi:hypothetical protein
MTQNPPGDFSGTRDFRAEMAHRRREDDERRKLELAEQVSPFKTPEARIRIWEQRHRLSLPRNPAHQLIDVIAVATALTRAEVLEEQRQRADSASAAKAAALAPSAS